MCVRIPSKVNIILTYDAPPSEPTHLAHMGSIGPQVL